MTKSRPALSVKRKQTAVIAKSKSAAGKVKDKPRKANEEELIIDQFDPISVGIIQRDAIDLERLRENESKMIIERDELQTRLTAALAEAEAWKGGQEELKNRIEELGVEMRNWAELHEKDAEELEDTQNKLYTARANYEKLLADSTDLHADQLLQANTLKALREELKVAKKDATDWALNHEKEKRRADGLALRPIWLEVFLIAGLAALGMSFAGYWHGKIGADRYWHEHILEVSDRPQGKVLYQLLGSKRCLGFDYHETPAADDPGRVVDFYYMVLDSGTCKF